MQTLLPELYGNISDTEHWYLWTCTPDEAQLITQWFAGPDTEPAARLARSMRDRNVWYSIACSDRRGRVSQRMQQTVGGIAPTILLGIGADIDFGKDRTPATLDQALEFTLGLSFKPTALVFSGHGLQPLWLFNEPWRFDDLEDARALTYGWGQYVNRLAAKHGWQFDAVHDITRVFRLPGTVNLKFPDSPVEAELLWIEPDRRFNPSDFDEWAQPAPPLTGNAPPIAATEFPTEKVKLLCAADPDFAATWEHTRKVGDGSCSAYDMSLAAFAVKAGLPDDEIAAIISENQRRYGNKPGKAGRAGYLGRTIAKARRQPMDASALLQQIAAAEDAQAVVFDAVPLLARMPSAEVDTIKQAAKAREPKINLRVLSTTIAEERKRLKRERAHARVEEGGRPVVTLGRQLRDVTADATGILDEANNPPCLFIRSGDLARVTSDEHGRPIIGAVGTDELRHRLAEVATFVHVGEEGERDADPPVALAQNILAAWTWPFPPLLGVVEAPCLRPDGSLLTAPGYDPQTRLYHVPADGLHVPTIPDRPTATELATAVDMLLDLLGDFPFDSEASLANTLALMLTPILRPAIAGPVPLALVDAPQAGSGKSLLGEVVAQIATGRAAALMTAARDDAEWEKRITALLLTGATVILIDNVAGTLDAPSLAAVLTAETWQARPLGRNQETLVVSPRAVWVGTGNNLSLAGDMPRRCYWVRLDAQSSRPWQRSGFRYPNLVSHVAEHRGELLGALLTIARAWFAAGQPEPQGAPELGKFEAWRHAVGGALHVAGVPGFLANLESMYATSDAEGDEWQRFVETWAEAFGDRPVTAARLCEVAFRPESEGYFGPLADVFPSACLDGAGTPNTRKLGKALRAKAEVRYGPEGLRIVRYASQGRAGDSKSLRWAVLR